MTPLEQSRKKLDYMQRQLIADRKYKHFPTELHGLMQDALDALEAVLAKEEKDASKTGWTYDERMGYNSALSEVHSLIASALGGGGE